MAEWVLRPVPFLERCNRQFGDVFRVRFVIGDIVFIADPHLIKTIFTGDPDVLHAGEANAPPLEPIMGNNSVLLLDGPQHMRQRKLMLPSFHGERMQRYGNLIAEITICCHNHAHINAHRLAAAQTLKLALLQNPKQHDLCVRRQFSDLIEQNRAAIGDAKTSQPWMVGPGERAFDMAK